MKKARMFFEQVRTMSKQIHEYQDRIAEIETMLTKTTKDSNPNHVQGGKGGNLMEDGIIKMMELSNNMRELVEAYSVHLDKATRIINSMETDSQADVLHKYYVLDWSAIKIAEDWGKTRQWVYMVLDEALEQAEEMV